MDKKKLDTRD